MRLLTKLRQHLFPLIYKRTCQLGVGGKLIFGGKCSFSLKSKAKIIINGKTIISANGDNKLLSSITLGRNSTITLCDNTCIFYGCDIVVNDNAKLFIGKNSYINSHSIIHCNKEIHIGNNCAIAYGVKIMDSDEHSVNGERRTKKVTIGNNVWIGAGAIILSGTTIGDGSVIAAGSVITKDIPEHCLAAGIPAAIKRTNIKWEL